MNKSTQEIMTERAAATAACPLCGTKAEYKSAPSGNAWRHSGPTDDEVENADGGYVGYGVVCMACDFRGPFGHNEDRAIEAWNENAAMIAAGAAMFRDVAPATGVAS